jgi:hypothetical protein
MHVRNLTAASSIGYCAGGEGYWVGGLDRILLDRILLDRILCWKGWKDTGLDRIGYCSIGYWVGRILGWIG